VHVFVAGSHELGPQADSSVTVHWTQVPASQMPVPVRWVQSSLVVHSTQALSWQRGASAEEQSSVALQATHWLVAVSQTGVSPSQAEPSSAVHWTQVSVPVSQTGVEPRQWELWVHSTQSPVSALQSGVAPLHAPSQASEPPAPAAVPMPAWPLSPP
jgi:hypothetical protein